MKKKEKEQKYALKKLCNYCKIIAEKLRKRLRTYYNLSITSFLNSAGLSNLAEQKHSGFTGCFCAVRKETGHTG